MSTLFSLEQYFLILRKCLPQASSPCGAHLQFWHTEGAWGPTEGTKLYSVSEKGLRKMTSVKVAWEIQKMSSFPIQSEVSLCVYVCAQSCLTDKNIVARQCPLSMGLSWKEYGVGCHFFLQEIFPTQGRNPSFLLFLVLAGRFFTTEPPGKLVYIIPNVDLLENCSELLTRAMSLMPVFSC